MAVVAMGKLDSVVVGDIGVVGDTVVVGDTGVVGDTVGDTVGDSGGIPSSTGVLSHLLALGSKYIMILWQSFAILAMSPG